MAEGGAVRLETASSWMAKTVVLELERKRSGESSRRVAMMVNPCDRRAVEAFREMV